MTTLEQQALELLRDIVLASDSNNGESLMNCIESAREFLLDNGQDVPEEPLD